MRFSGKNLPIFIFCIGLAAWVFFLRWHSFDRPAWNLDEGIHATIARTILDGGVMYRDAIDQRTPLTYYLVAVVFWIFGENNMWALHAVLAGMVAATALGLFLIGRRWRNSATGIWAALIFCAFSNNLLYIGDAYSLSTEWFVILFSTWATWWFWRSWEQKSFWKSAVAGLGFAAAFLSKQPGLLDFGAPLAAVIYLAGTGRLRPVEAARQVAGLCTGFVALTALVFAYFWARGALDDFYFYAWTYNILYYGPETTVTDRWLAALGGLDIVWQKYPVVGFAVAAGVLTRIFQLVQRRPTEDESSTNPAGFHLLMWALLSLAAASSAGRIYHHYYLQFLPAFTLLAGWFLADCQTWFRASRSHIQKGFLAILLVAAVWSVFALPLRGPWPPSLGPDSGTDAATYIRENSQPTDKIFVWGYNPDFYLMADRRSASRYIYCSFLTGLIPWTNTEPGRDTNYAIVPGTMGILLRELGENQPKFIVDASLGEGRRFTKYPLNRFPKLDTYISSNYFEIEPIRFRAHGFRVLARKDAIGRMTPVPTTGVAVSGLQLPSISGPTVADLVPVEFQMHGYHSAGHLRRLELLVNDVPRESITFEPTARLTAIVAVHFDQLGRGPHRLSVRATATNGETRTGPVWEVECPPVSMPPEKLASFALPLREAGPPPERIRAPYGAAAQNEGGVQAFFVHAPSDISYALPPGAKQLSGRFGFRPGAYATTNLDRTDGAEFIITTINAAGQRTELLRRLLRPAEVTNDRGDQLFSITLPDSLKNGRIELVVTSGPSNNPTSDWTYWSDLLLQISR